MRYIKRSLPLLISLSVLSLVSSPSFAREVLTLGSPLPDGQTLVSAGGAFELGFFSPVGNASHRYVGIWYHKISVHTVVWVANREKPLLSRNGTLSITRNGTLILKDENSTAVIWSAIPYASGLADPVAQLLDSGNFVTKENGDEPSEVEYDSFAWQSFQHPADTHLPGLKFGWNRRTGSANLTSWASAGDPSPGPYTSFLDMEGYPQLTLWNGSTKYFRTGSSNGIQNGDPQFGMIIFDATATKDEAYFMIQPKNSFDIIRVTIGQTGLAQGFVWVEQNKNWNRFWYLPKDACDAESPCGPNGICDLNAPQMCDCPPGFQPKKAATWILMHDVSEGCVRKTPLDCPNVTKTKTTDGFTAMADMKMPDSDNVVVDRSLTLEQCKAKCLSNCSCTACASANTSSGIGCFMWSSDLIGLRVYNQVGQDLYFRLAAADLANLSAPEPSSKRSIITIVASLASCMIVVAFMTIFISRMLRRRTKGTLDSKHDKEGDDVELPLFDWATVLAATNNFSDDKMLGEGGFGIVYKGELTDGQDIAVKRLSKTSLQGIHEFKNEVALISKLQHRNLVRLLGCCIEGDERLLVYEYMPCKSLYANLFGKEVHMNWEVRNKIINGIARGLIYLHHDSQFRIIHRDLKASNILLDKDMYPKISDFGLARIFHDDIMNKTQRVVGTYGYMSPEYAMGGVFSVKSDVYSFGVLVLEIISGQKNKGAFLSEPNNYLLGYAWSLWNEGRSLELVDPTLGNNNFGTTEVMTCIKVGLLCVQEFPEDRPSMPRVIMMLVVTDSTLLPEPKKPGFLARSENSSFFLEKAEEDGCSINDVTLSSTLGR